MRRDGVATREEEEEEIKGEKGYTRHGEQLYQAGTLLGSVRPESLVCLGELTFACGVVGFQTIPWRLRSVFGQRATSSCWDYCNSSESLEA